MFFYPLFYSTNLMPGDLGDARFVNYILEHGYLWLTQTEIHKYFWDMPFFYPYKNTLAFSDMFIGGMFIYVPLRFLIKSPQTALQIWFIILSVLNFLSCYLFMIKVLKVKSLPASVAAFLFAFGLPRHVQIGHYQLYLQFFMMFSLTAFFSVNQENSKLKNNILFAIGSLMFVVQLYSCFYLGWFYILGTFLAAVIGLSYPETRKTIVKNIITYKKELFFSAIISFALLIPLIDHYLSVGSKFGWSPEFLLRHYCLFISESKFDNMIIHNPFTKHLNGEITVGIGYLTTIFVLIGFIFSKYRIQLLLFVGLILYFFSNYDANSLLYKYFPGAVAIRASGRCIFLLLPIYAAGLANFLKNTKYFAIIFAILVIFEQIPFGTGFSWTKTEHESRLKTYSLPKDCKAIYYEYKKITPVENIDIMWFASNNNVYAANGYSGYMPPYFKDTIPKNCVIKK